MGRHRIGQSRKRWVTGAASLALAALVAGGALAGDSSGKASNWRQQLREQEKKQFLREHSDASGKPRPDLWRKGVEDQKKMQVAPNIGWHPTTTGHGKSASTDKQQ